MKPLTKSDPLYDQVVEEVRKAIITGTLTPGQMVSAPQIAAQLGVSRTPVRDAILQLQREGLVAIIARRGVLILEPTVADLEDLFQFREPLEGAAAALAAERADTDILGALEFAFEQHAEAVSNHDLEEHMARDEEFHELIAQASRNRRIGEALLSVRGQLRVYTRTLSAQPGAMDGAVVEAHRAILEAIRAGDRDRARARARAHVRGVFDIYVRYSHMLPATSPHLSFDRRATDPRRG